MFLSLSNSYQRAAKKSFLVFIWWPKCGFIPGERQHWPDPKEGTVPPCLTSFSNCLEQILSRNQTLLTPSVLKFSTTTELSQSSQFMRCFGHVILVSFLWSPILQHIWMKRECKSRRSKKHYGFLGYRVVMFPHIWFAFSLRVEGAIKVDKSNKMGTGLGVWLSFCSDWISCCLVGGIWGCIGHLR